MGFRLRRSFSLVFPLFWLFCGLIPSGETLLADIVRMRDGRVLEGRIRSQNPKTLVIRTVRGTRRVLKRDVDEIIYRPFKFPPAIRRDNKEPVNKSKVDKPGRKTAVVPGSEKFPKRAGPRSPSAAFTLPRVFGIMGRAAVLPGWGHAYENRMEQARRVGFVFAAGAGLALLLNRHALERGEVFESAGRDSLNLALFLPANEALGPSIDFRRATGIVLTDRWNKKNRRFREAANLADGATTLLLAYYFAQILHAAWPELKGSFAAALTPTVLPGRRRVGAAGFVFAWRFEL